MIWNHRQTLVCFIRHAANDDSVFVSPSGAKRSRGMPVRNLEGKAAGSLDVARDDGAWMMESLDQIKARIEAPVPGAKIEIVANGSPSQQDSLLIDNEHAVATARFLRVDPALRLDFCSNVTGVDWLARVVEKTIKVKTVVEGVEKEVDQNN